MKISVEVAESILNQMYDCDSFLGGLGRGISECIAYGVTEAELMLICEDQSGDYPDVHTAYTRLRDYLGNYVDAANTSQDN